MATSSVNAIDAILRATSPRLIVTAVTIGATGGSFVKAKNTAALSPASITLTTSITGLTAPTYQWYYATSTAPTTWNSIAGATSSSYVVTNTNFNTHRGSGTQVVYKCVATQTGWATTESSIIITYSQQSNDVPVATLSKTALSLPTTAADVVDYTASACDIVVSIGGTNIPYAASGANTYSVAVSATNITAGTATTTTTTVANDTRSFGVMSAMTAGQVTATITYTVTARDIDGIATTIKLVQTITKATAGNSSTEVNMSSSTVALNADASGVVTTFTNSGNTFTVSNGGTSFIFAGTGTAAGTFKITAVASNVTAGTFTGQGTATATLSNITAFTANTSGSLTFTISVYLTSGTATVFTRVQNFVQTKPGNTLLFAYRILTSTSLPSAPTISSGVGGGWADASNTPYTGSPPSADGKWYNTPPASLGSNDWCFQVSGSRSPSNVYTWQGPAYLSTFKVGSLSALAAEIGALTITAGTGSGISSGSWTKWSWPTTGTSGYIMTDKGLAMGSNGSVHYSGFSLLAGAMYRVHTVGTTPWNSYGAGASPSVGTVFTSTYTGTLTGTGAVSDGYSMSATSCVVGSTYRILTPGTTNFVAAGSANSSINTVFTCTNVPTGTGTVSPVSYVVIGYDGSIDAYGFNVTNGKLTVNQVDVIDTLNLKGGSVTNKTSQDSGYVSASAAYNSSTSSVTTGNLSGMVTTAGNIRHMAAQCMVYITSTNAAIDHYRYVISSSDSGGISGSSPYAEGYIKVSEGIGTSSQVTQFDISMIGYESTTSAATHNITFTISITCRDSAGGVVNFSSSTTNGLVATIVDFICVEYKR